MNYFERVPTCTVNVLGTVYAIFTDVPEDDDPVLNGKSAYCDKTVHRIVVAAPGDDAELADLAGHKKRLLRHELIHAFMFESGLGVNSVWYMDGEEHPEQTVDWMAVQFPKMIEAFRTVGAL